MKQFTIFQINENVENSRYLSYCGLRSLKNLGLKFDIKNYEEVYTGNIIEGSPNMINVLDDIFRQFNINHPKDFKGHSLSVSDVVYIDGHYWFCDSYGWEDVTDKVIKKEAKTYKVTYFTKELDVENVITYHNIDDQGFLLDTIAINIYTLELAEVVKCETADENYTEAVNQLIKGRLAKLAA